MRKIVHNKIFCILLLVSILMLGIYCEDIHTDSSFSYVSGEISSASLQPVHNVSNTDSYCEKNSLGSLETFISIQQSRCNPSVSKLGHLLILALLIVGTYRLSFSFRNSFLHTDAFTNRYQQRTLKYIHHIDGKKA